MDSVLSAKTTPDQTEIFLLQTDLFFDMLPVDSTVRTAKVTGNN
jgi:hypothetical protein